MFPIDTATSRDILFLFFPEHDSNNHSVEGASKTSDSLVLRCSCKSLLEIHETQVKQRTFLKITSDDGTERSVFWKLSDVVSRLTDLLQVGRPTS